MNGYYLTCRLIFILLSGNYPGGFPALCIDFGPQGWDLLTDQDRTLLKKLANRFKKSNLWRLEKKRRGHSEQSLFIDNVFKSEYEREYFYNILKPAFHSLK